MKEFVYYNMMTDELYVLTGIYVVLNETHHLHDIIVYIGEL